ncbi:MAG: hypothetical protein ACI9OJ_001197, partial [Myxococcota bacterium]
MVRFGAWAALVASAAVLIGLGLYQVWLLPPTILRPVLLVAIALVGIGLLVGLVRRHDRIGLAQRLDHANDLKDRLGTALSLMGKPEPERNSFEQAQIVDAMQFAGNVQVQPAAPWIFPREIAFVAGLIAICWGLTYATLSPPSQDGHGVRPMLFGEAGPATLLPPEELVAV